MKFLSAILDLFMPRVCHICGHRLSEGEEFLCASCVTSLPRTFYHRDPLNPMAQRFAGRVPYEWATGYMQYTHDGHLAVLIHDFKYRGYSGLARRLGEIMGQELLMAGMLSDVDVILPIPMHIHKQARRGYNQVKLLAEGISRKSGIPVGDNLYARRAHKTQTAMNHDERLRNTEGIFSVRHPEELAGRHVLLLDDVCTTGATLLSASGELLALAAPPRLSLLTLATV